MDVAIFQAINGLAGQFEWLDWLMYQLGRPKFLMPPGLAALAWWMWRQRIESALGGPALFALLGVGDFLGAQVKWLIARPRPCRVLSDVHEISGCGGTFSFPSNHALNTAAAAAFLQMLYPKTGWVSWPLVAMIGFSRIYVGGHYLTDVLGGWVIGGALGAGVALLLLRWPNFRSAESDERPMDEAGRTGAGAVR